MGQLIINGNPARLLSVAGGGGGGGGGTPEFTITTLADNSEGARDITISQDYHNFDIIGFDISNTTAADSLRIFITPAGIDAIFAVTENLSNRINLNLRNTVKYICFDYNSSTKTFAYHASRESTKCWGIYGYKCTNKDVTEETLFVTDTASGTAITLDLTGDDKHFFDYDYLFFVANSGVGDYSEFQPCQDIFCFPANELRRAPLIYFFNAYNSQTIVSLTDQTASAAQYLFVSGMKFS
jgi:hypothetical protein